MRGQGALDDGPCRVGRPSGGIAHPHFAARVRRALGDPRRLLFQALELEIAERRLFLWLPVAARSGAVWYLLADREPSLWQAGAAAAVFVGLAFVLRGKYLTELGKHSTVGMGQ